MKTDLEIVEELTKQILSNCDKIKETKEYGQNHNVDVSKIIKKCEFNISELMLALSKTKHFKYVCGVRD